MTLASETGNFEAIVEYLRQNRGFDFTAYKPTSLVRRVRRRMQTIGVERFDAYLDHLQVHPEEFAALFNTILINVTTFFRDPEMWDVLRDTIVPAIIEARAPSDPIRVWSAGSASGQEACSIAMVLAEVLGLDAFRERVKIYATDLDTEALAEARRATYTEKQVADVPPALLERYFTRANGSEVYTFDRELRRAMIFGRHDLLSDAPVSRIDLLFCRNTLMYFNSEAQARVLGRFAFALNGGGYLVLGRAELLFSHGDLFVPADLKRRIFKGSGRAHHRARLATLVDKGREDVLGTSPDHARLRDAVFESSADAQLVVDSAGTLMAMNLAARRIFGLSQSAVGAPLHNLEVSYRPADLRSALDRVNNDRRETTLRAQPWEQSTGTRYFDVTASPLLDRDASIIGIRVVFSDVTPLKSLQEELKESKQELETAYEELQSTNEELETTNEELQSTVEELETTNEELQSTNEELETMNEELQSTNEELQTMNDELRNRSLELNTSNAFLESVFTGLRAAVVVLDRDLRIQVWNAGAIDMWGLRPDETVGASFFTLDFGLPVGELHQPIREVLSGTVPQRDAVLAATNRKGRSLRCEVSIAPLKTAERGVTGAIMLMEEQTGAAPA